MLYKEYFKTEKESVQIKMSISFNRDSHNWATSQPLQVGYRIHATPVTITKHDRFQMEEYGAFTGFGDTLLVVERQSAKRLEMAKSIMNERLQQYLQFFEDKYGYSMPKLNELKA